MRDIFFNDAETALKEVQHQLKSVGQLCSIIRSQSGFSWPACQEGVSSLYSVIAHQNPFLEHENPTALLAEALADLNAARHDFNVRIHHIEVAISDYICHHQTQCDACLVNPERRIKSKGVFPSKDYMQKGKDGRDKGALALQRNVQQTEGPNSSAVPRIFPENVPDGRYMNPRSAPLAPKTGIPPRNPLRLVRSNPSVRAPQKRYSFPGQRYLSAISSSEELRTSRSASHSSSRNHPSQIHSLDAVDTYGEWMSDELGLDIRQPPGDAERPTRRSQHRLREWLRREFTTKGRRQRRVQGLERSGKAMARF